MTQPTNNSRSILLVAGALTLLATIALGFSGYWMMVWIMLAIGLGSIAAGFMMDTDSAQDATASGPAVDQPAA